MLARVMIEGEDQVKINGLAETLAGEIERAVGAPS